MCRQKMQFYVDRLFHKTGKTSKQCNNTSDGNIVTVRLLSDTHQAAGDAEQR